MGDGGGEVDANVRRGDLCFGAGWEAYKEAFPGCYGELTSATSISQSFTLEPTQFTLLRFISIFQSLLASNRRKSSTMHALKFAPLLAALLASSAFAKYDKAACADSAIAAAVNKMWENDSTTEGNLVINTACDCVEDAVAKSGDLGACKEHLPGCMFSLFE